MCCNSKMQSYIHSICLTPNCRYAHLRNATHQCDQRKMCMSACIIPLWLNQNQQLHHHRSTGAQVFLCLGPWSRTYTPSATHASARTHTHIYTKPAHTHIPVGIMHRQMLFREPRTSFFPKEEQVVCQSVNSSPQSRNACAYISKLKVCAILWQFIFCLLVAGAAALDGYMISLFRRSY